MNIVLQRRPSAHGATIGELTINGRHICYTLEDVVREVPGHPVESWKVRGQTAIPAGSYKLTRENSPRFGPGTLTVHNVPGFVGIRMHGGNRADDTEGCPLLGLQVTDSTIVGGTSKPAVDLVKGIVLAANASGDQTFLIVRNPA